MNVNELSITQYCFVKEEFVKEKLVGYTLTAKDGYEMRIKHDPVEEQDEEMHEEELWFNTLSIPSSCDFSLIEIRKKNEITDKSEQ